MFTVDVKKKLEEYSEDVSKHLTEYLPKANDGQAQVVKAMRYSLLNGGKRLRPVFVLEFCKMCGGDAEKQCLRLCNRIYTYLFAYSR